jgi:hypothetical protein
MKKLLLLALLLFTISCSNDYAPNFESTLKVVNSEGNVDTIKVRYYQLLAGSSNCGLLNLYDGNHNLLIANIKSFSILTTEELK